MLFLSCCQHMCNCANSCAMPRADIFLIFAGKSKAACIKQPVIGNPAEKMNKFTKKLTRQLAQNPKMLFLTDSIGALLSAAVLFLMLQNLSPFIGMPETALMLLLKTAACLFLYSAVCFLLLREKWGVFISIISAANALYCLLTLLFLILHYKELTCLGLVYFIGETALIIVLVYIELQTAAEILSPKT